MIRWILLFQEFDLEIRDKQGSENVVADHLLRLESAGEEKGTYISECFPDEHKSRDHSAMVCRLCELHGIWSVAS